MVDEISPAKWIRGRVIANGPTRCVVILGNVEHGMSREQAIAMGVRLLEVGIGTSYTEEREVNAAIGDIVSAWKSRKAAS